MNIFCTNRLTTKQYNEAKELIEKCRVEDNSRGISFLEQEMNEIPTYPCFFLMYKDSTLVSFLSVFIPEKDTCEVYANTLPEERGKGHFTKLLSILRERNAEFRIKNMNLVNDPACVSGTEAMKKLGATYISSDHLMGYDMSITPNPQGILTLEVKDDEELAEYSAYLGDTYVGGSMVEHIRGTACIYDFYIEEEYRGKGYGSELLLLILKHLKEHDSRKILLHVNNENVVAETMYLHHGFVNEEQLDYWKLD